MRYPFPDGDRDALRIYGHFAMDRLWKKLVIFWRGNLVRHVGNAGRRCVDLRDGQFFGQDLAGDRTTFFLVSSSVCDRRHGLFGKLLNIRPSQLKTSGRAQGYGRMITKRSSRSRLFCSLASAQFFCLPHTNKPCQPGSR